ncbi:MAG: hypothetical protein DRG63_08170 [Deltaproteobacteria bacterium]|nr:MAG: hypothetical protein DRG63_08170 [Deltaproteobacteria bacterium]
MNMKLERDSKLKNSRQFNAHTPLRKLDELLLERELLDRTYQLIMDLSYEIQSSVEYVTYNLNFLRYAQHQINDLFENWSQMIHALRNRDWNNISIDKVQTEKLLDEFREISAELPHAISDSLMGIKEISKLTELLEFLHPGPKQKVLLDIPSLIDNTIILLPSKAKSRIKIRTTLSEPATPIYCYPFLLKHAIREILLNSIDAISEHWANANKTEQGVAIEISTSADTNDHYVEIHISDNGSGIPEDIKEKIFEPYFTTRKKRGLGLTIAQWVIEQKHMGSLLIESKNSRGTMAKIRLPLS